jgi:hypothetical protein
MAVALLPFIAGAPFHDLSPLSKVHNPSRQRLNWHLPNLPALVLSLLVQHVAILRNCPLSQGDAEWPPVVFWLGDWWAPLSPPQVRGEVVVLKGDAERLRVLMETERLTKAMMVGQTKEEMPPDMRGMPMEPLVQSMAAAEAV